MHRFENRLALISHISGLVLVTYLSLSSITKPSGDVIGFLRIDALLHVLAYGFLGVTAGGCLRYGPKMLSYLFLVGLYGGGLELSQAVIPGRFGSWGDFLANMSGLILSVVFVAVFPRYRAIVRT